MNLPAEVREKAARAAQNRVGRVAYEYWTEVVDAVSEVLAEHQAGGGPPVADEQWFKDAATCSLTPEEADSFDAALKDCRPKITRTGKGLWRPGRKVGRTIYRQAGDEPSDDDPLIGVMDTPDDAMYACMSVNLEGSTDLLVESTEKLAAKYERLDRKLSKQRKRRKAAEAELHSLRSGYCDQLAFERDALQARVEALRAALVAVDANGCCEGESWDSKKTCLATGAVFCEACTAHAALAADDRAAGRTEEET